MAFGSEMLLLLGAGFVVLGPKRMQAMLGQIGRAKAQFDKASRSFMSEIKDQPGETTHAAAPAVKVEKRDHVELLLPDELIEKIVNSPTT